VDKNGLRFQQSHPAGLPAGQGITAFAFAYPTTGEMKPQFHYCQDTGRAGQGRLMRRELRQTAKNRKKLKKRLTDAKRRWYNTTMLSLLT
jgi:hypothetical protein